MRIKARHVPPVAVSQPSHLHRVGLTKNLDLISQYGIHISHPRLPHQYQSHFYNYSLLSSLSIMAPIHSPFLDILPAELRLRIYEQLLVSQEPLRGPVARQDTKYGLHTAILRTNKQIHSEALPIFLGKNTFYITSVQPLSSYDNEDEEEGSGAFEPPLQLTSLPLIRHLEIDLSYYPSTLRTTTGQRTGVWRPMCVGAERYIISLSYLLGAVRKNLLSLKLCADTRRYVEEEEASLDTKNLLTGPHIADSSSRFRKALSDLSVQHISLHYDFPESCFDFTVEMDVLCRQSLVDITGQVLIARSAIKLKSAMWELGEGDEVADKGIVDLMPR
jgi:hypothetical protein